VRERPMKINYFPIGIIIIVTRKMIKKIKKIQWKKKWVCAVVIVILVGGWSILAHKQKSKTN
jgi:hypothetical protein